MTESPTLKPGDKVVCFGTVARMEPHGIVTARGEFVPDDPPRFYPTFEGFPWAGMNIKPDPTPILRDLSREGGTGAGTYTAEDGEMHCVYCHGVMRIHPLAPGQPGITYEHELGCPIVRARVWLEGR